MKGSDAPARVPAANCLLAALPALEHDLLLPHLEPVSLPFKMVLYEPGQPIDHLYFPTAGVVSLLTVLDGGSFEVGLVGREGMVGLPVFLGTGVTPARCLVQVPGEALRLPAEVLSSQVRRDGTLHGLLLRYTHAFLAQLSRSIACNALHPVDKRLCRWLLAVHSRAESERFPLTHEFLAAMLGVRRASVTVAARKLRQAELIRYGGGYLTVLDRAGLEEAACDCHRVIQAEFDGLSGGGESFTSRFGPRAGPGY